MGCLASRMEGEQHPTIVRTAFEAGFLAYIMDDSVNELIYDEWGGGYTTHGSARRLHFWIYSVEEVDFRLSSSYNKYP